MKVAIATDHGGFELKEAIKKEFSAYEFVDYGTNSSESVDYPDIVRKAAKAVADGELSRGIALCGTGIGASLVANRYCGVRAALCHDAFTAEMCRKHNDANILVLGGRVVDEETAFRIVRLFFETEFEGGRHARRVKKIEELGCCGGE